MQRINRNQEVKAKSLSHFKLKVVLKYLSNNFTIAQICSEFNISKATLSNWVKQFKTNSSNVFSDNLINNKATKIKEKQAEKGNRKSFLPNYYLDLYKFLLV